MHSKLLCSIAALVALTSSSACSSGGPDPVARGSASASWALLRAGTFSTCARVGATSVTLLLHNRASGEDSASSFACADKQGTTSLVPVGTYDATLALRAADGFTMATAPIQSSILITAGQVTTLRPATFAVAGRLGELVLSLAPVIPGPICRPRDQGGQGITGHTIAVLHADGSCAAVTFRRMRGDTELSRYTVDCSSPPVAPCIERDETLQAIDSAPGAYAVSVSAFRGPVHCGGGEDVVLIPANGSAAKSIEMAPVSNIGC